MVKEKKAVFGTILPYQVYLSNFDYYTLKQGNLLIDSFKFTEK